MRRNGIFVYNWLIVAVLFSANLAQAGESDQGPVRNSQSSFMGRCLINAGKASMNDIKNMASKFGPEVVLDMMFSSVNPVFQPALLTKSSEEPAKPVRNIEDMRENKYFQNAITYTTITAPWIKVTADGRVIAPQPESEKSTDFNNWLRLPYVLPANSRHAKTEIMMEPIASGAMQRY